MDFGRFARSATTLAAVPVPEPEPAVAQSVIWRTAFLQGTALSPVAGVLLWEAASYMVCYLFAKLKKGGTSNLTMNELDKILLENKDRFNIRIGMRMISVILILLKRAPLPCSFTVFLFPMFLGLNGLYDEDKDNGYSSHPLVVLARLACALSLISVVGDPISAQYSFYLITSSLLAKKIDNIGHRSTAAIGLMAILLRQTSNFVSWPWARLGVLILGLVVYELHDEMKIPLLGNFYASKIGQSIVKYLAGPTLPFTLACLGILPPEWLFFISAAYPVGKIAFVKNQKVQLKQGPM